LYTMQNTIYHPDKLKKIERLIFKFIWNGPDKIKRRIMIQDYLSGGLKAPDIFTIDQTCKLKQVLRCASSNHSMATIQNSKFDLRQLYHKSSSNDKFTNSAVKTLNKIGDRIIKEFNNCTDELIHIKHYEYLCYANPGSISKFIGLNPIQEAYLRAEMKQFNINTLKELYLHYNEHRTTQASIVINKLNVKTISNLEKIINEETTIDCTKLPVRLNIFRQIGKIKSRDLLVNDTSVHNDDVKASFKNCRSISHPRERMIQYLILHNKFYNNKRLYDHKIIDSPSCDICDLPEDNEHMLLRCPKAATIWSLTSKLTKSIISENDILNGVEDKWLNNIISFARFMIVTNRSEPKSPTEIEARINNRISDIVFINLNKTNQMSLIKDKFTIINHSKTA
jgi:hypothetical protein